MGWELLPSKSADMLSPSIAYCKHYNTILTWLKPTSTWETSTKTRGDPVRQLLATSGHCN